MTTINSNEIDKRIAEIVAKIEKAERKETFSPALEKAGVEVRDEMRQQPIKAPGAFSKLATPGQRRAYWAKVRSGEAKHSDASGYVRRGSAIKWDSRVDFGKEAVIWIRHEAPRYVWGQQQQPFIAVSRWPQADDVLQSKADVIVGFFEDALEDAWRR